VEPNAPAKIDVRKPLLRSYRELVVWQKAFALIIEVYSITKGFPRDEIYGLTSQLRRSAVSIPSNIAEGQGRATKGEFIQFLCHARGSLFELETQIVIAKELAYIAPEVEERVRVQVTEVARILNGLLTSLGISSRKS
jgi:four helix bundle protein